MQRDAMLLLENGADGIVFGILNADRTVDTKRCSEMIELAGAKQTVFHRAFDVVPDPNRALRAANRSALHSRAHQRTEEDGAGRERSHPQFA